MTTFHDPATGGSGDTLALADINGHFVLVRPVSYEATVNTKMGERDAIKVNVVDLSTGEHFLDVLWFSRVIVGGLKNQIGQLVLAQVGQGTAKPGQSAPWVLNPATTNPQVVGAAEAWLAANPGVLEGFTAPTPTTPAAPAGVAPGLAATPPAPTLA